MEQLVKERDLSLTDSSDVVGEKVNVSLYDSPRWVFPRRDVDWDAVDFSWIFYDRNRKRRLGYLLDIAYQKVQLCKGWLQYLCRQFGWREHSRYPCITCGLPYTVDPADRRLDD